MKKNNKGFSLVEIIIVVAIIAVLVGLISPMFLSHVQKSKKMVDVENMNRAIQAAQIAYADGEYTSGQIAFVDKSGKLTGEKPAQGYGKGNSTASNVHFEAGCCEKGVYADGQNHQGDYLVVLFPEDGSSQVHVHWVGEQEATEIATASSGTNASDKTYTMAKLYVSGDYDEAGNMTFAKAVLSGRSSAVACKNKNGVDTVSFNTLFGIEDYVLNEGVSGKPIETWLKEQDLEVKCVSTKVLTCIDTTESSLTMGQVYEATQYLYYGDGNQKGDANQKCAIALYGERTVYAKAVSATGAKYYWDEACTQLVDNKTCTEWTVTE